MRESLIIGNPWNVLQASTLQSVFCFFIEFKGFFWCAWRFIASKSAKQKCQAKVPSWQNVKMAERIRIDFGHHHCCSGPCNITEPLHHSEPDKFRYDQLLYPGHTKTVHVLRGFQCTPCGHRYRELWKAFDFAVDNKDFELMHAVEEYFEKDGLAVQQKIQHLCTTAPQHADCIQSQSHLLPTIFERASSSNI